MHTTLAMKKQEHFKVKVSASKRRCSSDCTYIPSTKDENLFAFRHNKNSLWLIKCWFTLSQKKNNYRKKCQDINFCNVDCNMAKTQKSYFFMEIE